jgi:hypothetical protein
MARAIQGQNLATTMAVVLLAALVLLIASVFVIGRATTTGERVGTSVISSEGDGGARVNGDPYLDRHSAVVARYRSSGGTHALSQDGTGGSSLTRDPAIERHAALVARYHREGPR